MHLCPQELVPLLLGSGYVYAFWKVAVETRWRYWYLRRSATRVTDNCRARTMLMEED